MIDLQNMTVLIADDAPTIRKAIKSSMIILGYGGEFFQAENGQEALAQLHANEIDMVILDYHMPVMMGTEVLAYIRSDRNLRDIPVIMVTADANKDVVAQAAESEIDAYLLKPITVKALEDKLVSIAHEANNPTPMRSHLKRAKDFEETGQLDQAIEAVRLALAANRRSSRPVRELGCLFLRKGDEREAERWFLKAAQMNYLDVVASHCLGEIYLKHDDIEKAVHYFDKAMAVSPHHVERCLDFGRALLRKGLVDRASKVFKKAFDVSKRDLKLVEDVAEMAIEEGAKEYAAGLLERVIARGPDRGDLLFKLGTLLCELGMGRKAVNPLLLAEKKDKSNLDIKIQLAKAYLAIGHPLRAETVVRKVLKADPEHEEAKELFLRC